MTSENHNDVQQDSGGRSRLIQIAVGIAGVLMLLLLVVLGIAASKL
jgi:hypothetical protein